MKRYEGLWRSKAGHFSMRDFDQFDVSYTAKAILIIRDLLWWKATEPGSVKYTDYAFDKTTATTVNRATIWSTW